jgi:hypothetical protein
MSGQPTNSSNCSSTATISQQDRSRLLATALSGYPFIRKQVSLQGSTLTFVASKRGRYGAGSFVPFR